MLRIRSGTRLLNPFTLLERMGLQKGQRVADLGCGSLGHFVFPAAQIVGSLGAVYAVDVQRHVLSRIETLAKEHQLWNITPVWADIETYGGTRIESGSVDLALLVSTLWSVKNRANLMREMARLTRPGGRIVVFDWKPMEESLGPPLQQRVSEGEARALFQHPLFTDQTLFEAGPSHYGVSATRTDTLPDAT